MSLRDTRFKWENKPPLGCQLDPDWAAEYGLIAWWLLNENGGVLVNDISPTRNSGTYTNPASPQTQWATPGRDGAAISLVIASSQYVTMGNVLGFTTEPFGCECWFRTTGNPGTLQTLMGKGILAVNKGYGLYIDTTNHLVAQVRNGGTVSSVTSSATVNDGLWHHGYLTRIGGVTTLYLDGKSVGTDSTAVTIATDTTLFTLGARDDGGARAFYFGGQIAGAMVGRTGTTADQVKRLASEPYAGILPPNTRRWFVGVGAVIGIAFDAVSNSTYQAATSSYSWSHTCTGSNRYLSVDVSLLSAGQTVTSITYNGVALSFIGAQTTVSSVGRIECWGLVAPSSGTNTITVTLSGAIASAGTAVSYTNVNQTTPTEAFNSAQATNIGAADATVTVTTITNNTWIHAAIATNDGSITANQTSRNNVTGVGGSGADEDTGPISPAAATIMSYTGIGAAQTWAIAGYALRPISASSYDGWGGMCTVWPSNAISNTVLVSY